MEQKYLSLCASPLNGKKIRENFVKEMDREMYCRWKYELNLPGSSTGSYSMNLNHLWLTGSVVLQWELESGKGPNFEEWYYPGLTKDLTHLEVSKGNAIVKIQELKRDDA